MSFKTIRMESPSGNTNLVGHFILQQRMHKKIMALKLDWAKFDVEKFKDIYCGVVLEMSMDRLQRLSVLDDETEIVWFLRKKGNSTVEKRKNKTKLQCENGSSSPASPCSAHALQEEPA